MVLVHVHYVKKGLLSIVLNIVHHAWLIVKDVLEWSYPFAYNAGKGLFFLERIVYHALHIVKLVRLLVIPQFVQNAILGIT